MSFWLSQISAWFDLLQVNEAGWKEPCRNYKISSKSPSCTYNSCPWIPFVKPVSQSSVQIMPHCLALNYRLVYHTVVLSFCKDRSQTYLSRHVRSDRWFEWKHSTAGKIVCLFRSWNWYFNSWGFFSPYRFFHVELISVQETGWCLFFFFFNVDMSCFRIICIRLLCWKHAKWRGLDGPVPIYVVMSSLFW